jgi:O-antigen/teichoic acid export membrane protein
MYLAMFIIGFFPIKNIFGYLKNNKEEIPLKSIVFYAFPTIIAIFSLVSFTSTDVLLVKHFFNPQDAALYAGLSLIGKVIFYFTGMIPMVMFPLIVKRNTLGKRFDNLFYLSLLLVLIPSLLITGFYFAFPKLVISLFLGRSSYFALVPYLGLFGVYLTVFSLLNVFINFFLSLNKTKIAPLILLAAASQIIAITFFHSSLLQVIYSSLIVCSLLLIALLTYYFYERRKFKIPVSSLPVENFPPL